MDVRNLLVDYVAPLFHGKYKQEHNGTSPKLTYTAKFGRSITYDDSPAFYELEGVTYIHTHTHTHTYIHTYIHTNIHSYL